MSYLKEEVCALPYLRISVVALFRLLVLSHHSNNRTTWRYLFPGPSLDLNMPFFQIGSSLPADTFL